MKIAIIAEKATIQHGGAERSAIELTAALNNTNHSATLLTVTVPPRTNAPAPVKIEPLFQTQNPKRISLEQIRRALDEHQKQNHYDILHSLLPIPNVDVYQPRGGSYRAAMLHNCDSYSCPVKRFLKRYTHGMNLRRVRLIRAEQKLCTTSPTPYIAALSRFSADHFKKFYPAAAEKILTIPNAVNTDAQPHDKQKWQQLLEKSKIKDTPRATLYLFAAHNPRLKGLRELLLAFAHAVRQAPNIRLITVSKADLSSYRKLAKKLAIEDSALFFPPAPQIQGLLDACDIAVLPSFYDPSSRFILEALAMEKPVITTAQNGAADYIQNQTHGIIIDHPRQKRQLASALIHFANHENRSRAAQAIRTDTLSQKVSIQNHASQLIELYEKILRDKKDTP